MSVEKVRVVIKLETVEGTAEMSHYCNLSREDQAKVDSKLAELQRNTGQFWACEVTQLPQGANRNPLLEITVDGHISKPIALKEDGANPADRICSELDRFSLQRNSVLTRQESSTQPSI